MTIKVNDQVIVKEQQRFTRDAEIKCGKVVSVNGDRVSVQFPDQMATKDFPMDKVAVAKDTFGAGTNFDNPYEMPVQKLYR